MAERVHLDEAAKQSGKSEITIRRLIKAEKIPFEKEPTLTGFVYLVNPEDVKAYYATKGKTVTPAAADAVVEAQPETEVPVEQAAPSLPEEAEVQEMPAEEVPVEEAVEEAPAVTEPEEARPAEVTAEESDVIPIRTTKKQVAETEVQEEKKSPGRPVVGAEVSGMGDYWRKRAEVYEQRLNQEMAEQEELQKEVERLRAMVGNNAPAKKPGILSPVSAVSVKEAPRETKAEKKEDSILGEVPETNAATVIMWVVGILLFAAALGSILYWFYINLQ